MAEDSKQELPAWLGLFADGTAGCRFCGVHLDYVEGVLRVEHAVECDRPAMADKPIREQSALELLETHAKALEGYCMENARLREVLAKAANRLGAHDSTCASYSTSDDDLVEHFEPKDCNCYLEGVTVETAGCREHAAWEHVKALQCPVCKELRPAVETGACNHHFSELLASKDNAFEMRQCLECAKIFRVRLPEKTEAEHRR